MRTPLTIKGNNILNSFPLDSRSNSPAISRTASAQRILRRSTLMPTPLSVRTPPSSLPRRQRTGRQRASSTRCTVSLTHNARRPSRPRSRPSRPTAALRKTMQRRKMTSRRVAALFFFGFVAMYCLYPTALHHAMTQKQAMPRHSMLHLESDYTWSDPTM